MRNKQLFIGNARLALACGLSLAAMAGAVAQPAAPESTSAASRQSLTERIAALKASGANTAALDPQALGSSTADLVYTPITPCRIVDSRIAGGRLSANVTKTFDVDGQNASSPSFAAQGGSSAGCGVPYGVSYAVAMTITSVHPSTSGFFTAWGLGTKPNSSVLNFAYDTAAANTTILPVVPGAGNDFSVASSTASDIVIDVVGYFAPPGVTAAVALDCTNVASAVTTIPNNVYTAVDANCPAGYSVTGGGTYPIDGTLGRPQVWTDGSPNAASGNGWRVWFDNQTGSNRSGQTYARCCRVPSRY